jgi:hypothetical protein
MTKTQKSNSTEQNPEIALSIRQPFAEQIMLGIKKIEYRSIRTHKRERVWIYASLQNGGDERDWRKVRSEPGELPVGVVVGSVEIVDCEDKDGYFEWKLANPKKLKTPKAVTGRPQPLFFRPF